MNFRLIGVAALSLMLATPAMAMQHGYHRHHRIHKEWQVQMAPKFGYRSTYRAYDFYPEDEFAPDNDNFDFDRRNTFN